MIIPLTRFLRCLLLSVAVFILQSAIVLGESPIDPNLARQYFQEAKALSDRDGGRMWGLEVYGPMMFVEPNSRSVVANQADREGNLVRKGDVYVGTLSPGEPIGNSVILWAGVEWSMMTWPLPTMKGNRLCLMAHEMWHRIQERLGFSAASPGNGHLNERDGRTWLQLEWRALIEALKHLDTERRRAIEDALCFRAYRRSLFPKAAAEERALEMHEGLAEYSGIRLSTDSDRMAFARTLMNLRRGTEYESFIRSFAYASGPAYGYLLDKAKPDWRKNLRGRDDLGQLLKEAMGISPSGDLEAMAHQRANAYDADQLIAVEAKRNDLHKMTLAEYRKRFVDNPVLVIPLRMAKLQFDPGGLQPLDELGTVHKAITINDLWGTLTVTRGALLTEKGWFRSQVTVPAPGDPSARPLTGDGWTLELKEGWGLHPGERKGDYGIKMMNTGG